MKNPIDFARDLGDCEIRSVSFVEDAVHYNIFNPYEDSTFTIVFHKLVYFMFESYHAQNVIDSIVIFKSVKDIDAEIVPQYFRDAIPKPPNIRDGSTVAYVRATTGGESIILFQEYEVRLG